MDAVNYKYENTSVFGVASKNKRDCSDSLHFFMNVCFALKGSKLFYYYFRLSERQRQLVLAGSTNASEEIWVNRNVANTLVQALLNQCI